MTALLRRSAVPGASAGSVDRAMRTLGLSGVRRDKGIRTTIPSKDGKRAGDLLDRDFTAPAPNRVWVTDFTYVRTWAGWVYVAFIVDVFAQRIVTWPDFHRWWGVGWCLCRSGVRGVGVRGTSLVGILTMWPRSSVV